MCAYVFCLCYVLFVFQSFCAAGPTFFKETRCCKTLLNTSRYPLKARAIDTRWRIILRRIHRPSKIRRATQTQKPCYSITQCIRAAFVNIFVANIFAPLWKRFAKFFGRENFATYGIEYYILHLLCTFMHCIASDKYKVRFKTI